MGGVSDMASGAYKWAGDNPDALFRAGAAAAPMFGMPAASGPLNILAGATGIGKSDERNVDYAKRRADAERAITAYKKANEANPGQTEVPSPTSDQWILNSGGGVPQQKQDVARQTTADIGAMSQQAQQRRADAFKTSQQPLSQFRPPAMMGGQQGGPMFAKPQQGASALQGNPGSSDMLARYIAALKQGQQGNPWKVGGA